MAKQTEKNSPQTMAFQAEVKQLLQLMIHSLYSNKEIVLRELISNASDAADKLRFEALANSALYESDSELKIRIAFDKEARTVTISDNGIGFSLDKIKQVYTEFRTGSKFKDEGVGLGSIGTVDEIDFTGTNVTATRAGNKITIDVTGGSGSGSGETILKSFIAGEVINGGKAVIIDDDGKIYHMDITNSDHWYKLLGIASTSAIINDPVNIVINRITEVLGSGWIAGKGYYIASTGFLAITAPINGLCKQVGVGIDIDKISINHYSEFAVI